MLKPEAAKKQLKQWLVISDEEEDSPVDRFLPAVKKLPKKLRDIGFSLMGRDAKGSDDWDDWSKCLEFQQSQRQVLDQLARRDRNRLFRTFFGGLAGDIELTWQWMKSVPYGDSYSRIPFRAPTAPEVTLDIRAEWLSQLLSVAAGLQSDVLTPQWLAAWIPHLEIGWSSHAEEVAYLLAAVIDAGGKRADEVFEILCQSARKEHEVGAMGEHVTLALLSASRPEGWELMEKMLLAAQRQEGLRQVILNSVVQAHPEAFRRMLRLIIDENLSRFSSVVQAMDLWLGMAWAAKGVKKVNDTIETVARLLEKSTDRKKALAGSDAETAYLALWATAFDDASASIKPAEKLLGHPDVEMRYVAASHLSRVRIPAAQAARARTLGDGDLRVALCALSGPIGEDDLEGDEVDGGSQLFDALEKLFLRLPAKPTKLKPLVWPWTEVTTRRDQVGNQLVASLGNRSPARLIPHLKQFDTWGRANAVERLAAQKKWDGVTRDAIFVLVGDASPDVRESALDALNKAKIKAADAKRLEPLLTRTAVDLRKGVVSLLISLPDKATLASAGRLLASKNQHQRLAGLEILRQLAAAERERALCIKMAEQWRDERRKVLKAEQSQLDAILASAEEVVTLDDALGLMDPARRSKAITPRKLKVQCMSAAVPKILKSLDDLVRKHRQEKVSFMQWGHTQTESLLGEIEYGFPGPDFEKPAKPQLVNLPLRETWEQWYQKRPVSLKDKDGLELLRTWVIVRMTGHWRDVYDEFKEQAKKSSDWKAIEKLVVGTSKLPNLKYPTIVNELVDWLMVMHPPKGGIDFCADVVETLCALIPAQNMQAIERSTEPEPDRDGEEEDWRELMAISTWNSTLDTLMSLPSQKPTKKQRTRFWQLLRWLDEPFEGAKRSRPGFQQVLNAYSRGVARLEDVADHLLGCRDDSGWGISFDSLRDVTSRQSAKKIRETWPEIADLVGRCTERLLEIELARGEAATPASAAALSVSTYRGTDTLLTLLGALGKDGFKTARGWRTQAKDGRLTTFTKLVEKVFPEETDTPEMFAKAVRGAIKEGQFPEERLLQLAFHAPQWTDFIQATLKWNGFCEGIYWYMAHMKYVWGMDQALEDDEDANDATSESDDDDEGRPQKLSRWDRIILERTPLSAEERGAGAIDVAWFHRTYKQLSPKRWEALAAAAKFAAASAQAKRAQFISDTLLGRVKKKDLIDGIRKKNLKENVRLLGLLPLAGGAKREPDIADRYEALQQYRRYANKLSSMSKPDALRACDIGLRNLASTAGYADPLRLQWAMEAASTKDLAQGPVVAAKGDVSLTLSLDEQAQPELTIRRGEKVLKSLPQKVRKDRPLVELRERAGHLKKQASRVKQSLEIAMCRSDSFSGAELMQLADHALLWPQLQRLVLVGEGILGYPDKRGKALRRFDGKLEPVKKAEKFRIAHPFDLLQTKAWNKWQHECFHAERLQPFKQVFRELYVVTRQEKLDKTVSNRYAGQQVNPRQAHALWGSRGWSVDEYGNVWKAFHDEGLNVSVAFDYGITTPLEVEGLTIDTVQFSRRDEYKPLALAAVEPRVFSEVMRDMDLVVSVAHVGDVDPEASASTVEMRSSLLCETCRLLGLKNVKLKDTHAIIKGQLGEYSLHLGSGVVHRLPGGSVCIVPVHAQHRGRLFLPFADDDPRTAEVVSKTLLLARDDEIDDPIILEQLRAMA